ncbi:hypothetical protein SISNIDRAFT_466581 [Sistotremastrum niveocremeum HHB9708]|uniref:Uncharacterized protein n=1 Tax=Sistotremastrum niveocremeum HHB9708 TaxID=1314777 RepID=A0A164TW75_9AGAM|nr:hypothetical protein SISNIDRAFT_466581 [Sistotremastrum niveocremeum HHB9708]
MHPLKRPLEFFIPLPLPNNHIPRAHPPIPLLAFPLSLHSSPSGSLQPQMQIYTRSQRRTISLPRLIRKNPKHDIRSTELSHYSCWDHVRWGWGVGCCGGWGGEWMAGGREIAGVEGFAGAHGLLSPSGILRSNIRKRRLSGGKEGSEEDEDDDEEDADEETDADAEADVGDGVKKRAKRDTSVIVFGLGYVRERGNERIKRGERGAEFIGEDVSGDVSDIQPTFNTLPRTLSSNT